MPDPVSAIVGSSVLGAGASIFSGSQAADAQRDAAGQASGTTMQMYNQNRADMAPWRQTGEQALNRLGQMAGFGGQDTQAPTQPNYQYSIQGGPSPYGGLLGKIVNSVAGQIPQLGIQQPVSQPRQTSPGVPFQFSPSDPSYQFRLSEGQNALDNSLLARGQGLSGAGLKAGQRYAQDYASTEFGNEWNRMAGLAGVGQSAAGQIGAYGANAASNIAQNQIGAGNAAAAGWANTGNAITGGINQGMSLYGNTQGWGQQGQVPLWNQSAGYGRY